MTDDDPIQSDLFAVILAEFRGSDWWKKGEPPPTSLPEGARSWDDLLQKPLRFAPWPYSNEQLALIRKALPPPADDAIAFVIFSARQFMARMAQKRNERAKPDPNKELLHILTQVEDLQMSIREVGIEAMRHLDEHPSPGTNETRMNLNALSLALHRFKHDNRVALSSKNLPPPLAQGRPSKSADEWLLYQFWTGWRLAHIGKLPRRGWPAFLAAVTDPLTKFGLADRDTKGWQDILAKAKARTQTPGKSRPK